MAYPTFCVLPMRTSKAVQYLPIAWQTQSAMASLISTETKRAPSSRNPRCRLHTMRLLGCIFWMLTLPPARAMSVSESIQEYLEEANLEAIEDAWIEAVDSRPDDLDYFSAVASAFRAFSQRKAAV